MPPTNKDIQLAALATGFTLGFGFLTVWQAIKQTMRNRNRYRSLYICMIWGEILANTILVVIGWLFLHGELRPTIPVLFMILVAWAFQVQLLMQIIVNRIALIAENRRTVRWAKWSTAAILTSINISVFCIWIPSHTIPAHPTFVRINEIWDKIEKVLILSLNVLLNFFFLRIVKQRLVKQHGLKKYQPLVGFHVKLMIVSTGMDGMLIGLMFLKNHLIYIVFHPVVYIIKLNMELSMASLVIKLAQNQGMEDRNIEGRHSTNRDSFVRPRIMVGPQHTKQSQTKDSIQLATRNKRRSSLIKTFRLSKIDSEENLGGIQLRTEVDVTVEQVDHVLEEGSVRSSNEMTRSAFDDAPSTREGSVVKEMPV